MFKCSKSILILISILSLTFLAYIPSLKAGFINFDDSLHLTKNPDVQRLDFEHIKRIFKSEVSRTYIPLSLVTYSIEYHFFKLNPFIYHLNNVLLHLMVIALVFSLAQRFKLSTTASFIAALVFGIHPMHVESVAWVTERKDVLCGVFYLSTLLAYWKYLDRGANCLQWYFLAMILGLLAILSKPMAFSLPAVLFLLDWWTKRKWGVSWILDKLPMIVYIFIFSLMTVTANKIISGFQFHQMMLVWIWSFIFYIQKFIFPDYFILVYTLPDPVSFLNPVYTEAVIKFVLLLFLLFRFFNFRLFIFSILFYSLTIAVLIVRNAWEFGSYTVIADRFMYLPSIGFCFLFGYGIQKLIEFWKHSKIIKEVISVVVCFILIFLTYKTYQQCLMWKDGLQLWSNTIKFNPNLTLAYVNRSYIYMDVGRLDLAMRDLEIAQALNSTEKIKDERIYIARGIVYYIQNKFDLAYDNFNKTLEINPRNLDGLYDRGIIWRHRMQLDKAFNDFKAMTAIRQDPRAYVGMGTIYQLKGEYDQALSFYNQALSLDPEYQEAKNYKEQILNRQKK